MSQRHIAIIGFGSIARDLITILYGQQEPGPRTLSVLTRETKEQTTKAEIDHQLAGKPVQIEVLSDLDELLASRPQMVVECAGHEAVKAYAARILERGIDLLVASVGALADADFMRELEQAARRGGAQLVVPAGAIGAIDSLGAARLSGLTSVSYTGRKPPMAWEGTPAEDIVPLRELNHSQQIFQGNARDAARLFPKNANVAATLALAGLGMDRTTVRLVADPTISENTHEFEVESKALNFSIQLVGKPSPTNPKTSRSTVFSIARVILAREQAIVI